MASVLISGLIPHLQQPGLMPHMEDKRQKLHKFFLDTQPVLANAEQRAEDEPEVRSWLVDLKAMAYDAENIVDDFKYAKLQEEAAETEQKSGCKVLFSCLKIRSICFPSHNERVLEGIGSRIASIVNRVDGLIESMRAFNFQSIQLEKVTMAERPQQAIFSRPTEISDLFVGREQEKDHIVDLLLHDETFESIHGPQGIGKTVLARSVCNDARIKKRFDPVIWVDVRSEFNIGKVGKSIIDQVIGKDSCLCESDTELIKQRLHEKLFGWSLVIMDDVWIENEQSFGKFKKFLKNFLPMFCAVLVTTRYNHGEQMLQCLTPDDQWNLFYKKAFPKGTCPEAEIIEMGRKIVGRCGGSPLAVNMMGGLMRFKKEPAECQEVIYHLQNSLNINNDTGDYIASLKAVMKVCYDNLSPQSKRCFEFCSVFPKGHLMDKEVLIQLWMANGLLPSDGLIPPEEKGNIVFNELASMHFLYHVTLVHEGSYDNQHGYPSKVKCKMLNLIYEQAEFALQFPYLFWSDDSQVDIPELVGKYPSTRILVYPDDPFIRDVNCSAVPRANSLRALHLRSALFKRDLFELKHMRHLWYLDLSGSRIRKLPETTNLLYFLETLNLSKCLLLHQLPENMKDMRSLRHLYIYKCPKLKRMPPHFKHLSNLQTLTTYIVGENAGNGIDEIKGLQLGGLLELYNLQMVKTTEKVADLVLNMNLDRLTLCWGSEQLVMSNKNNDLEVLEALQPYPGLKVLKVQQYGGCEFASWLADPVDQLANLVEFHLIGCSQCKTLPAVWKLPLLKVLFLKHMPRLSTFISGANKKERSKVFTRLRRLVLVGLKKLKRLYKGKGNVAFPMLDELEITGCPNLRLRTKPCFPQLRQITVSIENYRIQYQSVIDLITQSKSLAVANISESKASNADNAPFPELDEEAGSCANENFKIMRMDSTDSLFKSTALPDSLLSLFTPFTFLQYLDIFNCNTLEFWPAEFECLTKLTRLSIRMCPNLTGEYSPDTDFPGLPLASLQNLEFYGCGSLNQIPACNEFSFLQLDECPEVKSLSGARSLGQLSLSCISWTALPTGIKTFKTLTALRVSECYVLESLPDELASAKGLKTLVINECPMLKELPDGLERVLSSLETLQISMCPDLECFCKEGKYSTIISQIGQKKDDADADFEDHSDNADDDHHDDNAVDDDDDDDDSSDDNDDDDDDDVEDDNDDGDEDDEDEDEDEDDDDDDDSAW